jgi:hypothetical protein
VQNRYVGDVGDFAKYGLLRRLAGDPGERPIQLGVVWCLFPNETHNNDGRHVSYLRSAEFEALDDALLTALRNIIRSGMRCVSAVSSAGIFPDGTVFCDAVAAVPTAFRFSREDRALHRAAWLKECLMLTEKCDLVFFDPDNGVEVASVPKQHPNAGKYIYWDELIPFWQRGHTLLVYHHLNRTMPAARQVRGLRDRFRAKLDGAKVMSLVFRRGSCRVFWLVYRDTTLGAEMERRARDFLAAGWSRHFRPANWLDRNQTAARSTP